MNLSSKLRQLFSKIKSFQPIDNALVSTLYTLSIKSLLTAIVFTIFITMFLYSELSYGIILWAVLLITLLIFRLYIAYLFKKYPQMYSLEIWHKKFMIFAFLTGFLVSSLSFIFIPYLNDYHQLFVLASLLGLTGGATTSLSSDFRIAIIYISIILVPLIGSLFIIQSSSSTILAILMILFFISQISMIFNNYIEQKKIKELRIQKNLLDISLEQQLEKNKLLLNENKLFIADMVHQIKTPLSVIISNASLIEMRSNLEFSSYITQINSAINMLSNSYEDLSYIISNDTIKYKPIKINLTNFMHDRINFFDIIVQANDKTLIASIDQDLWITMNDTELERLIDNNISNAIKHSQPKSQIEIILEDHKDEIELKFISEGKKISNVAMIFNKNYTENHSAKRSLGLGLNMVRTICEKNHIDYSAHSEDNINTFTYIFKT